MSGQLADTSEQRYYESARTLLDLSLPDLFKVLPELQGLEPARSQDQLSPILASAGQAVTECYRDLPNVVADERITEEEFEGVGGRAKPTAQYEFNYMILAHRNQSEETLEEYRADAQGNRSEAKGMVEGLAFTEGFASMWCLFFPANQSQSKFRYLGRQSLEGRDANVIAFAQRPRWSSVSGRINSGGKTIVLLYQGLAWIDASNHRIMQMRLDLLAPRLDIYLERLTAEIRYGEIHISGTAPALWLAKGATITTVWNGRLFRNRHVYSDYHLFVVHTTIKPSPGEGPIPPEKPQ